MLVFLTFPTCLSLVLNLGVCGQLEVRTASADILKHVQVPGEIDRLTAESPGYLSSTKGCSTRHLQDKAEGTCFSGARTVHTCHCKVVFDSQ